MGLKPKKVGEGQARLQMATGAGMASCSPACLLVLGMKPGYPSQPSSHLDVAMQLSPN